MVGYLRLLGKVNVSTIWQRHWLWQQLQHDAIRPTCRSAAHVLPCIAINVLNFVHAHAAVDKKNIHTKVVLVSWQKAIARRATIIGKTGRLTTCWQVWQSCNNLTVFQTAISKERERARAWKPKDEDEDDDDEEEKEKWETTAAHRQLDRFLLCWGWISKHSNIVALRNMSNITNQLLIDVSQRQVTVVVQVDVNETLRIWQRKEKGQNRHRNITHTLRGNSNLHRVKQLYWTVMNINAMKTTARHAQ